MRENVKYKIERTQIMTKSRKEQEQDAKSYFKFIFICGDEVVISHKTNSFPVKCVDSNAAHSWNEIAINVAKKVFTIDETLVKEHDNEHEKSSIEDFAKSVKLIRMLRLWYPLAKNQQNTYLQRFTLFKKLTESDRAYIQIQNADFVWKPINEVQVDPEHTELLTMLKSLANEQQASFLGKELTQDEFIFDAKIKPVCHSRKNQSVLMAGADFSLNDQIAIYRYFVDQTFPYFYLSKSKFEELMLQLGWDKSQIPTLFTAFKLTKHSNPVLSYPEFISGLAACEPFTPHGDTCGEIRCRYIFRYYDRNHDGKLEFEEFVNMVRDIRQLRGASVEDEDVREEALNSAKVFGASQTESLSVADFLSGVGQLKFRGTSTLFRSQKSVLEILAVETTDSDELGSNGSSSPNDSPVSKRRRKEANFDPCECLQESVANGDVQDMSLGGPTVPEDEYEFATHVIKVKRSGQIIDVSTLWEMDSGAISMSSHIPSKVEPFTFNRSDSIKAFNTGSEANEMLRGLRYFERGYQSKDPKLKDKMPYSWGPVDMRTVASALIDLCKEVRAIFMQEPRLLKLNAPTYVLGDVHGNFRDLVCFEKTLWRMGIALTPSNFLFLGDYVDRGAHGVEVVAYLFAQKIVAPNKFHLLRGNHEHRRIQENFTFRRECVEKFGNGELADRVWNAVNMAFDAMPIAAVVDTKIFCVHGGIPPPWMSGGGLISNLDKVPNSIRDPEEEEPLVWQYLWNDPLPNGQELPPEYTLDSSGFVPNFKRGTGHLFSDKALGDFLNRNHLSHLIRAHEVKEVGFQVQHKRKLLTVFSSSHYCNGSNDAATVLIDNKKLRLIRLDTT